MAYRVDNIPFYLKPLFWLYGYVLGFLLYAFIMLLRFTCRIRFEGEEVLRDHPTVILCSWHENAPSGFVVLHRLIRGPQVSMSHPAWYMKPVHIMLWLLGVRRLVLGSTGYEGREAATKLVKYLQGGYSTIILPDGPKGRFTWPLSPTSHLWPSRPGSRTPMFPALGTRKDSPTPSPKSRSSIRNLSLSLLLTSMKNLRNSPRPLARETFCGA
jgi:uncharacterized protein DUF374